MFRISIVCTLLLGALVPLSGRAAAPEADVSAGCTVTSGGDSVNGSRMWADIPNAKNPANCNFHRFACNNFLHLVRDEAGHPRFLSMASPDELFPASGEPSWPGGYTPLDAMRSVKSNRVKLDEVETGQAGDDFELVDVYDRTVVYDIRVKQPFFDFVTGQGLYRFSSTRRTRPGPVRPSMSTG